MKTTDIVKNNASFSKEELHQLQIIFKGLSEKELYDICMYQGTLLSVRQIRTAIRLLGKENILNGILQNQENLENYIKIHSINLSDIFGMEYLNFTTQTKENLYVGIAGSKENSQKGELLISAKLPPLYLFDTKKEITKLLSNDKQLNQIAIEAINKNDPSDKKFFWLSKELSGYIGEKIISYRDKLKANKIDITDIPEKEIADFKKYISANIQSIIDQGLMLLPEHGLYDFMPHIVSYRALKEKHISNILNNDDSLKQFRELISSGKFQEIENMFSHDEKQQASVETKNESNIIPQSIFDEFRQKKEKSNGIKHLDEKQEHIPNEFQNAGFQVTRATQTGQRTPEVIDIYLNNLEKRPQHFSHAIGVLYIQNLLKKGKIKINPEKILSLGSGPHEELRAYINANNQGNIDHVPDVISLDMSLDFLQKSKQKTPDLNKYIQGTMLYSQKNILDFSNIKGSFDVIGNMGKLEKFSNKNMDMIECSSFDNLKNNQENELKDMLVNSLRILKQDGILKFYLHKRFSPEFVSILKEYGINIINEYDESMSNHFSKAFTRYGLFLATKDKEIDIESFKNDIKNISIYAPTIRRKSENNEAISTKEENQELLSQNIIKVINNDLYTLENPDILKSYIQYLEKHNELTENIIIQLINAYFNKKTDIFIQKFLIEYFKTNSLFLKHLTEIYLSGNQEPKGFEFAPKSAKYIREEAKFNNDVEKMKWIYDNVSYNLDHTINIIKLKKIFCEDISGENKKYNWEDAKQLAESKGYRLLSDYNDCDPEDIKKNSDWYKVINLFSNGNGDTVEGMKLFRDIIGCNSRYWTSTKYKNEKGEEISDFAIDRGLNFLGCSRKRDDTRYNTLACGFKDSMYGIVKNDSKEVVIHDERGFNKLGIHKDTGTAYNLEGFNKKGFNEKGIHEYTGTKFDERGFNEKGIHEDTGTKFDRIGFNKKLIHKDTGTTYNLEGFNERGFNEKCIHKYTGTKFDLAGFDKDGIHEYTGTKFDERGFNEKGIHKDTGTKFDRRGFAKNGNHKDTGIKFDRRGFAQNGNHKDTGTFLNLAGFDKDGNHKDTLTKFDKEGFDIDGNHKDTGTKFDKDGNHKDTGTKFDKKGFDKDGNHKDTGTKFDGKGFDKDGNHKDTGTKFDKKGFDKDGNHKDTGTKFDGKGYDIYGCNRYGCDRRGFDKDGNHKDTGTKFNRKGFNKEGIHKDTGTRFDKNLYDMYGRHISLFSKDSPYRGGI